MSRSSSLLVDIVVDLGRSQVFVQIEADFEMKIEYMKTRQYLSMRRYWSCEGDIMS